MKEFSISLNLVSRGTCWDQFAFVFSVHAVYGYTRTGFARWRQTLLASGLWKVEVRQHACVHRFPPQPNWSFQRETKADCTGSETKRTGRQTGCAVPEREKSLQLAAEPLSPGVWASILSSENIAGRFVTQGASDGWVPRLHSRY